MVNLPSCYLFCAFYNYITISEYTEANFYSLTLIREVCKWQIYFFFWRHFELQISINWTCEDDATVLGLSLCAKNEKKSFLTHLSFSTYS